MTAAPTELAFGDITRQGLPFYGGSITYSMHFEMDREKDILVKVPHFTAPVLEVWIDGKRAGLIAFAPHTLSLGRAPNWARTSDIMINSHALWRV